MTRVGSFRTAALVLWFACAGAALTSCATAPEDSVAGGGGWGASDGDDPGSGGDGGWGPSLGTGGTSIDVEPDDAGGTPQPGCNKIDFLFVVDNSVSMQNEQALLVQAFPGFIAAIESTLKPDTDYHVMVVDTDEWGRCPTANPWTGCCNGKESGTCNDYIYNTTFEECDRTLGAGVVHPAGAFASNKLCPFPNGRRYLAKGDKNLAAKFGCAARVGTAGHGHERPMEAMIAALQPSINGPGGCNEGFLRDDALLVVTFISDDPNYADSGGPKAWYDAVVAAKHGDPKAIAMVGFTPAFDGCQDGAGPTEGAHWAKFVSMFDFKLHASVCAGNYANVFAQVVKVVDASCEQYVPPPPPR